MGPEGCLNVRAALSYASAASLSLAKLPRHRFRLPAKHSQQTNHKAGTVLKKKTRNPNITLIQNSRSIPHLNESQIICARLCIWYRACNTQAQTGHKTKRKSEQPCILGRRGPAKGWGGRSEGREEPAAASPSFIQTYGASDVRKCI